MSKSKTKALFLDRDGIINVDHGYTYQKEAFDWIPGIFELTKAAWDRNYRLVVITNQSGIARGYYGHEAVQDLHAYMQATFTQKGSPLDAIYYCPHHPEWNGTCLCRKPGTLLFERALATFKLDASACLMLGDKERDLIPAKQLGMQTILMGTSSSVYADREAKNLREIIPCLE